MKPGCLFFFALPFAGVGVFMLSISSRTVMKGIQSKSWVETPAQIMDLRWEISYGEDSEMYETTAVYQYEYNGQAYESTRVGITSGADNIGGYYGKIYDDMLPYFESGKLYRCYVNPNKPGYSLLNREIRWSMIIFQSIFGIIFGGIGFGLIAFALYTMKEERAKKNDLDRRVAKHRSRHG